MISVTGTIVMVIHHIKIMTYGEALIYIQDEVIKTLHDRLEETYPNMYVVVNTRDPKEYRKANPSMYRWYMEMSRAMLNMNIRHVDQRTEEDHINSEYACIERFHQELKETENVLKFLIENLRPT